MPITIKSVIYGRDIELNGLHDRNDITLIKLMIRIFIIKDYKT